MHTLCRKLRQTFGGACEAGGGVRVEGMRAVRPEERPEERKGHRDNARREIDLNK